MKFTMLLLALLVVQASGQLKPQPTKFDTYTEDAAGDLAVLNEKTGRFAKELQKFPKTSRGVIIYYTARGERNVDYCSKDPLTAEKRNIYVRDLLIKSQIPSERLLSIDGYLRLLTELEFWIVPKDAEVPEATPTTHIHCACATISVDGPTEIFDQNQNVKYSAFVSGASSDAVTYRWSVTNGKIVSGQGTPWIEVKGVRNQDKGITATVRVNGANGCCEFCNEKASLKTKFLHNPQ